MMINNEAISTPYFFTTFTNFAGSSKFLYCTFYQTTLQGCFETKQHNSLIKTLPESGWLMVTSMSALSSTRINKEEKQKNAQLQIYQCFLESLLGIDPRNLL